MFLDPLQRQQLKRNCYVLNLSNFCKIDLSSSQVFLFVHTQVSTQYIEIVHCPAEKCKNKCCFSTWSMSPTFPAISSSGRQRKPRGPTLYCKETSTCGKKVFDSLGTKMKNKYHITNQKNHVSRNKYHITLQELPRTSPNVSSKHERPTVDVNLFNKQLICRLSTIVFSILTVRVLPLKTRVKLYHSP